MRSTRHLTRTVLGVMGAAALAATLAACGGAPADGDETTTEETTAAEETTDATTEAEETEAGEGATNPNGLPTAEIGDCLDSSGVSGTAIPTVDCSAEHDAQVVGKFDLPDGDYPGDDGVQTGAQEGCLPAFEEFVGTSFDDSSLDMNFIYPTEDTWNSLEDREIICIAIGEAGTTESWEGSGV